MIDDATLVEQARSGNQAAFGELYERYFDRVYDFLARMVRDPSEAADLTQDTFLRAMNSLSSLSKGGSFKSWLFTIARNTALNRLERAARTQPLEGRELVAIEVGPGDHRQREHEDTAHRRRIDACLRAGVGGVGEHHRADETEHAGPPGASKRPTHELPPSPLPPAPLLAVRARRREVSEGRRPVRGRDRLLPTWPHGWFRRTCNAPFNVC